MGTGQSNEVKSYRAYVDTDGKFGGLILSFEDEPAVHLRPKKLKIYSAALDLLRNEAPVYYDAKRQFLQTGAEPVGEGE